MSDQNEDFLRRQDTQEVADNERDDLFDESEAPGGGEAGDRGPLVPEDASPDDWDGMALEEEAPSEEDGPDEEVSLDALMEAEAANDNRAEEDDNPYMESDEALPDDDEESAIREDLLDRLERGRFGD